MSFFAAAARGKWNAFVSGVKAAATGDCVIEVERESTEHLFKVPQCSSILYLLVLPDMTGREGDEFEI